MKNIVLSFAPDGTARVIFNEAFLLESLGSLSITRASTIEYNDRAQVWEVRFPGSAQVAFRSTSRAECLEWENNAVNNSI